jgi:PIN domain nuclease of toxin-antitoxin system
MAVKYVLDTHALIWYIEGNPRLGQSAKQVMDDATSELVLPAIALAEALDIIPKGRTSIPDVNTILQRILTDTRITIQPLTLAILEQSLVASAVPEMHDRLIAATALWLESLGHEANLLTMDPKIIAAALVRIVW